MMFNPFDPFGWGAQAEIDHHVKSANIVAERLKKWARMLRSEEKLDAIEDKITMLIKFYNAHHGKGNEDG